MSLLTKLTFARIALGIFILLFLLFPFYAVGITFPKYLLSGVVMDSKVLIAGGIFVVAAILDLVGGYLAKKKRQATDTSKMLDAMADKVLINSVLIVFASLGYIHVIIPVVLVIRDIFVSTIKMEATAKGKMLHTITSGKIKTVALMLGTILVFFYNMPFEIWNIRVDLFLLYFATIMALLSMIEYYQANKKILNFKDNSVN